MANKGSEANTTTTTSYNTNYTTTIGVTQQGVQGIVDTFAAYALATQTGAANLLTKLGAGKNGSPNGGGNFTNDSGGGGGGTGQNVTPYLLMGGLLMLFLFLKK